MKNILLVLVLLAVYGGALFYKNMEIEEKKKAYVPTTYDLQKKNGIPITTEDVKRARFQEFITITGKFVKGELRSSVAPFVRSKIRPGESARLELDSGETLFGKVTSVSSSPGLLTGLYEVKVAFNGQVPRGLSAVTVDIPVKEVSNVLVVPRVAISHREKEPYAFVVEGEKLKKKYVELAGANADVYWIKKGLAEKETVVTSDTRYFDGGEFVQVVNDTRKEL